jgi:hypothetical protein
VEDNESLPPDLAEPLEEKGTFSSFIESVVPPIPDFSDRPDPELSFAVEPTPGERLEARAEGIQRGFVKGTVGTFGAIGGGYGGYKLRPTAPTIPAVLGTVAGIVASDYIADEYLDFLYPTVIREDLKPEANFGEAFGQTLSFFTPARFIPEISIRSTNKFVDLFNFFGRMASKGGKVAREKPITTLVEETFGAIGAGIGAEQAETLFPGSIGARLAMEPAGALLVLSPYSILSKAVDAGAQVIGPGLRRGASSVYRALTGQNANLTEDELRELAANSPAGAKVAQLLQNQALQSGEDPEQLANLLLRQANLIDPETGNLIKQTSAQIAEDSPFLSGLELALAKNNDRFSKELGEQTRKSLLAYSVMLRNLEKSGDPEALRIAAEMRKKQHDVLLQTRLEQAYALSAQKINELTKGKLGPDTPPDIRAQIGQVIKDNIFSALEDARKAEREYWLKAIQSGLRQSKTGEISPRAVNAQSLVNSYLRAVSEIPTNLLNDSIPASLQKQMEEQFGITSDVIKAAREGRLTSEAFYQTGRLPDFVSPKNKQPALDLVDLRSALLKSAREMGAAGAVDKARIYGDMAESILEDLEKGLPTEAYKNAREFSRSLNDSFTRSFAGDVTATKRSGADRIPTEELVSRAFGANADATHRKIIEIQDAISFIPKEYERVVATKGINSPEAQLLAPFNEQARNRVGSIIEAQDTALRLIAAQAFRPDGTFSEATLSKLVRDYEPALRKLGLYQDLTDARTASELLSHTIKTDSVIKQGVYEMTAFGRILGRPGKRVDNPTTVIISSLTGNSPVQSYSQIAKLAKKAGAPAQAGLIRSTMEYALQQATAEGTGIVDPKRFETALFGKLNNIESNPSVMDLMLKNNLLTQSQVNDFKKLLKPMIKVKEALSRAIPEELDALAVNADPVTDLALRIAGSELGSFLAPSNPLIAQAAGSRFLRNLFENMPAATARQLLIDAVKDPKLMSMLLKKEYFPQGKVKLRRSLNGYLYSAGYTALSDTLGPEEEIQQVPMTSTTGAPAAQLLRQLPPAPQTTGVPGLTSAPRVTPQGPGPRAGPAAPAAPPMPGQPQQPNSRQMLQSLFPFDTTLRIGSPLQ